MSEIDALKAQIKELEESNAELKQSINGHYRVSRALRAISKCNQTMLHVGTESELLSQICHIIVDICSYRLAWIGFMQYTEDKSVLPVASAGYEKGYLEAIRISWADNEYGQGPTGTALRTGKPIICKNIPNDPNYAPWRAEATKRGYASSVALPLFINNKIIGALNIYAAEPDAFEEEELKLMLELAADCSFSITTLRQHIELENKTKELNDKIHNLEVFQKATVSREEKMIELKKKVAELESKLKDRSL